MNDTLDTSTERLVDEITRYLAAVDVFRTEGRRADLDRDRGHSYAGAAITGARGPDLGALRRSRSGGDGEPGGRR